MKYFLCSCLMLLMSISGSFFVYGQQSNATALEVPGVNLAIIKHEKNQWKFLRTTLEAERAHSESYRSSLGSFIRDKSTYFTELFVPIFSYLGGLFAAYYMQEQHFVLWHIASMIALVMSYTSDGIISTFGYILENHASNDRDALTSFVRGWYYYRQQCPEFVYPIFDGLFQDYQMHDSLRMLSEDQAHVLIEYMLALAYLAEHIDLKLLEDATPKDMKTTCAHVRSSQNNTLQEITAPQFGARHQWEYVAKQLGLLNPIYKVSSSGQHFLHTSMVPLTLLVGMPVGAVAGSLGMRVFLKKNENAGMVYGGLIGAAFMLLLCTYFGATHENTWYHDQLISFIEHWNFHRPYVPPTLYAMFDELQHIYLDENHHLDLNQKFIRELFQTIAVMWIKVAVSEAQ